MFDFGDANDQQKMAISSIEGPVLITAGPGTGKTYTLVQRALYIILEKKVLPENIMIATFTNKAARELVTRISSELLKRNIKVNINEMYIGTFHSICLRLLKENLEFTRLKKNFVTMDDFDQIYKVFQGIWHFENIDNYEKVIENQGKWKASIEICRLMNLLAEEEIGIAAMLNCKDVRLVTLGKIKQRYDKLLEDENLLDFSSIQTEAYRLLKTNPEILKKVREKIKYVMIDEYQDTNFIQEQLVFLIGSPLKNICIVGDDDQGLYRFRGATIRNILEFPGKFKKGECTRVDLKVNYRSNADIITFFNRWMSDEISSLSGFSWGHYRYEKDIVPDPSRKSVSPAVIRIGGSNDEWKERILDFILMLKKKGKIDDFNQIAFLFSSVKADKAQELANYLENNDVNVYSPRSDMFFQRREIRLAIGCMLRMFPFYKDEIENGVVKYLQKYDIEYYSSCLECAEKELKKKENKDLGHFVTSRASTHKNMEKNADYSFAGLIFEMLSLSPFREYLDTDLTGGVFDQRPIRNLSLLSQIVGKFEMLHGVDVLTPKYVEKNVRDLFSLYLKLLLNGGLGEYEDETEYAPSGCISFLTIHQAKGMEFPIVFVDSLSNSPRNSNDELIEMMEAEGLFNRKAFEPASEIKYFDFWRKYYTAFSRAQDLLVLCAEEKPREPSKYFRDIYENLPRSESKAFDIKRFEFCQTKEMNLVDTYSFTSHISVYENCPRQYKFYKELGFTPVREGSALFGRLVHQTIEDIHKTAIKGDSGKINDENITHWLSSNYASLSKMEHAYLGKAQIESALVQVKKYVDSQKGQWNKIQEAEVQIGLIRKDYVLEGTVDLIKGDKDTIEIVDFKSEKKPSTDKDKGRIDHYSKQLQVYAHLVEEKQQKKVSKMHLYFTSEDAGNAQITFDNKHSEVDRTMKEFDGVVSKIRKKDFSAGTDSVKVCSNCDFRYYCRKNPLRV